MNKKLYICALKLNEEFLNMKRYKIKYLLEGVTGTYYMSLLNEYDEYNLSQKDISYSARMELTKFLGTGQFKIISITEV